jgi:elongation factor G
MEKVTVENIHSLALLGHGGSGKTSLVEGLLNLCGHTTRLGRVDEGTATTDYDPEEKKRQISINLALAPCFYKGHKINLIDTPGYADFMGEVVSAVTAADSCLIVVDGVSGAQVQTDKTFHAAPPNLPKAFFINKLDKEHADFDQARQSIVDLLSIEPVPVQIPLGQAADFKGVIDLISFKALLYDDGKVKESEVPQDLQEKAEADREKLIEAAAEGNDELLEKYLEEGVLSPEEIIKGLKEAFLGGQFYPLFCGSAYQLKGLDLLLDNLISLFPTAVDKREITGKDRQGNEVKRKVDSNEPPVAQVFKTITDPYVGQLSYIKVFSGILKADSTIFNPNQGVKEKVGHLYMLRGKEQIEVKESLAGDIVTVPKLNQTECGDTLCAETSPIVLEKPSYPQPVFSAAIEPKSKGDEEKLSTCLQKLAEEDPTLQVFRNHETKQTIVSGLGDLHLEVLLSRLKEKFNVEARLGEPKIPYKETITKKAKAQGKYKRQSGGRGQYGDAWIEVEPLPKGSNFEFVDKIVGGVIPKNFIPAVEKGVKEAMESGIIAGYPVVDVRVTLFDGSHHSVDSSDMAFKIAGSLGFKSAAKEANPVLLEPIMNLEVMVPEKYMGDIIGDISSKRGKVLGMESRGKYQLVKAQAPLAELAKYATELRSLTHGEGSFLMEFSHYEEVPKEIAQRIIEEAKKEEASS